MSSKLHPCANRMHFSTLTAFAFAVLPAAAPASLSIEITLLDPPSAAQNALSANNPVRLLDNSTLLDRFYLYDDTFGKFLGTSNMSSQGGLPQYGPYPVPFILNNSILITYDYGLKQSFGLGIDPSSTSSPWRTVLSPIDPKAVYTPVKMATGTNVNGTLTLNTAIDSKSSIAEHALTIAHWAYRLW